MKSALSLSDEYSTPRPLFDALLQRYGPFDLDAAATKRNAKCGLYFTKKHNALVVSAQHGWGKMCVAPPRVWLNPPYSRGMLEKFLRASRREVVDGSSGLVCCLVPGHTAEGWWHDNVEWFTRPRSAIVFTSDLGAHTRAMMGGWDLETVRIRGRQSFEAKGAKSSARFPSVVVVFAQMGMLRDV